MSSQRAEDALRVARGLGLVVANAASQSRFLQLLQKDVVAAVQAAAQHAAQHAAQDRDSKSAPHSSTASYTYPTIPKQDFSTSAASTGRAVNVMYGYTAVQGSQLLFSTHATQHPVPSIAAPPKPLLVSSAPAADAMVAINAVKELERTVVAEPSSKNTNTEAHVPVQPAASAPELLTPPESEASAPEEDSSTVLPVPEKTPTEASTPHSQPIPPTITVQKRKFRERAVPSSRIGRAMGFAGLGAGLVWGATTDAVTRALGPASDEPRGVLSEANAQRLANALCRMRGAALKIGQMLSIQDEDMIPPAVSAALEQVRQQADVMPRHQLEATLAAQLGADWESKVASFEWEPAAAASIGQVHRAVLHDGRAVAMKIQYPGVADSIESDIDNLVNLLAVFNVAPRGLFLGEVTAVAKKELALECDYTHEAASQKKFRELLQAAPAEMRDSFQVPEVVDDLSSESVLCSTWVQGVPIDKVKDMPQDVRNRVGAALLRLTLQELFVWRFMQTDPNWGNFLYDEATGMMSLIDFGAARSFPKKFVDNYIRMVRACAQQDRATQLEASRKLGFLTGQEIPEMEEAHVQAGSLVGTPFGTQGTYDFGSHNQLTKRVAVHSATMLRHRLKAPPPEVYSLHRRLAGAFLVNMKLRAKVTCQQMFNEVYDSYSFGPEESVSLDSDQ